MLTENNPAIKGDKIQDKAMNPTLFHTNPSLPPYTNEKPMIEPIIEWVVETGQKPA